MNYREAPQLPIVRAGDESKTWLMPVQSALINTSGVFAISGMGELNWESGSHISRKVLKTYMRATMHNPWELHSGLDLHKGEAESASKLKTMSVVSKERHVDRGLFNIVEANPTDRKDLCFHLDGRPVDALSVTSAVASNETLLIVIPGYSLQAFEPKVQALIHEVKQEVFGAHARSTKVFQCRLRDDFNIHGRAVATVLAQASNPAPSPSYGPPPFNLFGGVTSSSVFGGVTAPSNGSFATPSYGPSSWGSPFGGVTAPSNGSFSFGPGSFPASNLFSSVPAPSHGNLFSGVPAPSHGVFGPPSNGVFGPPSFGPVSSPAPPSFGPVSSPAGSYESNPKPLSFD